MSRVARGVLIALASVACGAAYAQQSPGSSTSAVSDESQRREMRSFQEKPVRKPGVLQEVIVTGTHLRGDAPTGSPVRTYSSKDIAASGAQTTAQFIELLPQNFGGGISERTNATFVPVDGRTNNNSGNGTGVNLRGLGSDATLLLLNGHRLTSTGAGDYVDVSQIPVSAIERIDVLTDGASAIYGSDAVAGVVNIILRQDFEGAETRARYGSVTDGGFDRFGVGQTFGRAWESGSAWLSYDYTEQGNLTQQDRDFASLPVGDLIPAKRMHNVAVNGRQDIGAAALRYDGVYSHRNVEFFAPQSTSSLYADRRRDSVSDFYSAFIGVDLPTVGGWQPSLNVLYSDNRITADVTEQETGLLDSHRRFRNQLASVGADISGSLFALPAGDVKTTLGVDFRREDYDFQIFLQSDAVPIKDIENNREVKAIYAEALVPILRNDDSAGGTIDLSLAVRHEQYSDFGGTTNPKFGLVWSPFDGIQLRSTWGTSFRAESFNQSDDTENFTVLFDFPDPDFEQTSLALFQAGNTAKLEPEKSRSWTFGVELKPPSVDGFSASLDYFRTRFRNRIQAPSNAGFDILAKENVYASVIVRNPTPVQIAALVANPGQQGFFNSTDDVPENAVVLIDNRSQNIGSTDISGIDISAAQTLDFGAALWRFSIDATRVLHLDNKLTSAADPLDATGTVFNLPKWRARAGVSVMLRQLQIGAFVSHVPSYRNTLTFPDSNIASWTPVDASVSYDTTSDNSGLVRDLVLRLSVQNLLDKEPPRVSGAGALDLLPVGFDPANANPIGRFLSLDVAKRF